MQEKTKVRTSSAPMMGGYYGFRSGFYDPWPTYGMGIGYGTETHVNQYTEGTFNIDLVDASTHKLCLGSHWCRQDLTKNS
jgi:hypothetical protein